MTTASAAPSEKPKLKPIQKVGATEGDGLLNSDQINGKVRHATEIVNVKNITGRLVHTALSNIQPGREGQATVAECQILLGVIEEIL